MCVYIYIYIYIYSNHIKQCLFIVCTKEDVSDEHNTFTFISAVGAMNFNWVCFSLKRFWCLKGLGFPVSVISVISWTDVLDSFQRTARLITPSFMVLIACDLIVSLSERLVCWVSTEAGQRLFMVHVHSLMHLFYLYPSLFVKQKRRSECGSTVIIQPSVTVALH